MGLYASYIQLYYTGENRYNFILSSHLPHYRPDLSSSPSLSHTPHGPPEFISGNLLATKFIYAIVLHLVLFQFGLYLPEIVASIISQLREVVLFFLFLSRFVSFSFDTNEQKIYWFHVFRFMCFDMIFGWISKIAFSVLDLVIC